MDLARITEIAGRLSASNGWSAPDYIDNGASASVYKVETTNGAAALKVYDPAFFEGENALIESNRIELQRSLRAHGCPYMVEVLETGELAEDGTWYLLMDYCPWKSLEKRLADVPESQDTPPSKTTRVCS